MELSTEDKQRIEQKAYSYSGSKTGRDHFSRGAEYATIYEREQQAQQEIINNNIIEQLQIRVEQDLAKIKKLEDEAHDYSAWQSEYRASRAEVERLKAERSELVKENGILKIKNTEMESIRHNNKELANQIDELRNKVIDEAIDKLFRGVSLNEHQRGDIEQLLNSLKK